MNETIVLGSQSQHQPRASNKRKGKTLESDDNNVERSNDIDVDDYNYEDVIVIDFPALYPKSDRKSRSIICVDDVDNDGIDVEFEETSGKLKEQWEKAFSRRKLEVRVATKRALLSFHPDRASQSDIRQQVEAEEKFKLINRMKEKFAKS